MSEPEIMEIFKVVKPLSSLLVNIENQLKSRKEISLRDFCSQQQSNPIDLLYSKGISGLLSMGALIPIKEALEASGNDSLKNSDLRIARNALCHGKIKFLDTGKIEFTDRNEVRKLDARRIIDLAKTAWDNYQRQS